MYGKAIKCDMCQTTEILPEWPEHGLTDMFPGWVRVHINAPVLYKWHREDGAASTLNDGFDCCSIGCARDALSLAADMIPTEQDPASE